LYEEVMFSPHMQGYVVIGFIDDNPHCVGRKLCGVPVQHGREWIEQEWERVPERFGSPPGLFLRRVLCSWQHSGRKKLSCAGSSWR
jgi:hypothetical protein